LKIVYVIRRQNTNTLPPYLEQRRPSSNLRLQDMIKNDIATYCCKIAAHNCPSRPHMVIAIDTTSRGIGSAIIQSRYDHEQGWTEFPLRYSTVPFNASQQDLSSHAKESIAVNWTIQQFAHLVRFTSFSIRIDRRVYPILADQTSTKVTHWMSILTDNSLLFERAELPNDTNSAADALSR